MSSKPVQMSLDDVRYHRGRGGPRHGAGRPRGPRPRVVHRERQKVPNGAPVHVTLRVCKDVPHLRSKRFLRSLRQTLRKVCERGSFRVVHYSVQGDHLHLLVEASGKRALASGMKSVGARVARAVNRVFRRRGPVLDGRYHARVLRTPREVRAALAYVLLNVRRHHARRHHGAAPPVALDVASSGRWFDGWSMVPPGLDHLRPDEPEVARPRSWLLRVGWRRRGLVDPGEVPGVALARRATA